MFHFEIRDMPSPFRGPVPFPFSFVAPVALTALIAAGAAGPTAASTLSWKTAASGLASTASNWSPAKVPAAADDVLFNLAGTYTVTWDSLVTATHTHVYRQGVVTLATSKPHTVGSDIRVGDVSADVATMRMSSATVTSNGTLIVGNAAGATGTVSLLNPTASLTTTSTNNSMYVGDSGTGTLNITGGALLTAGFGCVVGNAPGAQGTVSVSGVGGSPLPRSTLQVKGGFGLLAVGNAGTGSLSVTSGALVTAPGAFTIAPGNVSSGTVTVSGASSGLAATIVDSTEIDVASNGAAGVNAGTGSLDIGSGGIVSTTGPVRVGDPDGGTGTLTLEAGGSLSCHGLSVNDAHGGFNFTGGVLGVNGAAFDPPGTVFDLNGAGGATLDLAGGASAAFSNSPLGAYSLIVGDGGAGTLNVLSGSTLTTTASTALGAAPGSSGTVNVSGGSAWTTPAAAQLAVGLGGTGSLSVSGPAQVDLTAVNVATGAGSTGSVSVKGGGATLTAVTLAVGGSGSTAGGTGSLTVSNGGAVQLTGDATTLTILAPGTVTVGTGSTITAPNQTTLAGKLVLAGGTLTTGQLLLETGSGFSGFGTVAGDIDAGAGSQVITASGGPLTLGTNADASGFFNAGTLSVGSSSVTVLDGATATLGSVTMDLGTLNVARGGQVPAGKSLSGRGTINGPLLNHGTISATNEGFTFDGILTNSGGTIGGTAIAFKGTGGFSGSGSLPLNSITGDPTTSVTATGTLAIGTGAAGSTMALQGRLDCGASAVSFATIGTAAQALGRITSLNGGSLNSTIGFIVPANDSIVGVGTVSGLLTNNGVVSPGFSAGTLHLANGFTQSSTGRLVIEIGNRSTDAFDQLTVSGAASLNGTLDVRLLPGTVPQPGQNFTFLTCGSRTGTFSAVTINGQPAGSQLSLLYGANGVTLHVNGVTVDAPGDPAAGVARVELVGFSGSIDVARFDLALPAAAHATLELYGVGGRAVVTLVDGDLPAGHTRVPLRDAGVRLARGVYFGRAAVRTAGGLDVRRAKIVVGR